MNMDLLANVLLILTIICTILALLRNVVLYYYKKNDRLSELEIHYIYKYHRIYGAAGLLFLSIYALLVSNLRFYVYGAFFTYIAGAIFAMASDYKNSKLIIFHQVFMILTIFFLLFQLFA
ncbi:MAG: hypothetical protein ACRCZJ_00990 [Erysipelotrichaceae bacterium]